MHVEPGIEEIPPLAEDAIEDGLVGERGLARLGYASG
jgi:hypothetical protein